MAIAAGAPILASDMLRAHNRVAGRGNRTTNKTGITTPAGVLRIDNMALQPGLYLVLVAGHRADSNNNPDINIPQVRYAVGATATTASTQMVKVEVADPYSGLLIGVLPVATAGVYSMLYVQERFGSGTVQVYAEGNGMNMVVVDLGIDPGDTGIDL